MKNVSLIKVMLIALGFGAGIMWILHKPVQPVVQISHETNASKASMVNTNPVKTFNAHVRPKLNGN